MKQLAKQIYADQTCNRVMNPVLHLPIIYIIYKLRPLCFSQMRMINHYQALTC